MKTNDLSPERLRVLLDYSPDTGVFTRRVRSGHAKTGDVAGTVASVGYRYISVDNRRQLAHRLAWLHVHGRWPDGYVDHINGLRDDNRIANLRECSNAENMQNIEAANKSNASGFRGVYLHKPSGLWASELRVGAKRHYLGYFSTPELAHEAYLAAKREHHEFWAQEAA